MQSLWASFSIKIPSFQYKNFHYEYRWSNDHLNGLMQERRNSIANALELLFFVLTHQSYLWWESYTWKDYLCWNGAQIYEVVIIPVCLHEMTQQQIPSLSSQSICDSLRFVWIQEVDESQRQLCFTRMMTPWNHVRNPFYNSISLKIKFQTNIKFTVIFNFWSSNDYKLEFLHLPQQLLL